ncbi:single-stranded DNA-binding protein [Actinorhabdospora filicis]|uniref:Single-stranded DNA-binding protein n=1 Tax=Actinorhabdospora filicis TaxID=1785913 RepID=A0A9W6SHF7_9ACTN|nr:single-stranded DNA-binding protein [Actinorhabdospora filicis]GLZ76050.1 single-stranded DNA-binding protein [Actinorhabdospora filicis]
MFETFITLIGDVTTKPVRHTSAPDGASLVEFGLAAKSRRHTRGDAWPEDETLSMRVLARRELGERVFASVSRGDPVIVHGSFHGRESPDPVTGRRRTVYEVEALHVGHDLSRGTAVFSRGDAGALTWPDDGPPELDRVVTGFGPAKVGSQA